MAGESFNGSYLDVVVIRYDANGTLDTGFGTGGSVTWHGGSGNDIGHALALQLDGKILVAGESFNGSYLQDLLLIRINIDGTVDTGFGNGGAFVWDRGHNKLDRGYALAVQGDGEVLLAGETWNSTLGDVLLMKFHAGAVTWDSTGLYYEYIEDKGYALALQPDGRILVAGSTEEGDTVPSYSDLLLNRYNADGTMDTGFGTGGSVTWGFTTWNDYGNHLAVRPDGTILVAGRSLGSDSLLVSFSADGIVDTTFGTDGYVISSSTNGHTMEIQDDGKILIAGHYSGTSPGPGDELVLTRYDTHGVLDTGFGIGGTVTWENSNAHDQGHALALEPDGDILVGGKSSEDALLMKYNMAGILDSDFGTGGNTTWDSGYGNDCNLALALRPDGKILAAGYSDNGSDYDVLVVRYNSDGTLDTGFGTGGVATWDSGYGDDYGRAMALQPDGKILVAGYSSSGSDYDVLVVRFSANGTLDTGFGTDGSLTFDGGWGDDYGYSMVLQPDGSILVAGTDYNGTDDDVLLMWVK